MFFSASPLALTQKANDGELYKVNPNEQQAAKAKLLCSHEKSEYRIRHDSWKRPLIALQCLKCGKRISDDVSPKKFSKEEIDTMPQWDKNLEVAWKAIIKAKSEEHNLQFQEQRALQKELQRSQYISQGSERQSAYSHYLKSEDWQNLRRKVLKRANSKCEGCGDKPTTDVHHLTYERLGNEMLFDLVALCKECHKKIHKQTKASAEANRAIGEALFQQTEVFSTPVE